MCVALVTDDLTGGGAEGIVARLAGGLAQRGRRIAVYCLHDPGAAGHALAEQGVTIRILPPGRPGPLASVQIGCWLRRDRVRVVNVHNSAAYVWTLPAAALLGVPVVRTLHGPLLTRSRAARLADALASCATRSVLVAESLRRRLPPALRRRALHIPNGVELPPRPAAEARAQLARACGRSLRGPVVLSVGTLCPEKDTLGLLRAFAQLRMRRPDATLVLVGTARTAAYAARVADEIAALALHDAVVLTGPLDDAWRLMAGADVLALASRTEALPGVLIEAMSQRVPIVATAVGDVGAMLEHGRTALLVAPGDPVALGDALETTLADPAAAHGRTERAAARHAAMFTAGPMLDRYERVFARCARSSGRPPCRPSKSKGLPRSTADTGVGRYAQVRRRVLHIGPDPRQIGGVNAAIANLLHSPLATRFELHRHWAPARPLADARGSDRKARPLAHARGSDRRPAAACGVSRLLSAACRHLAALWRLWTTIRTRRIDIVHIHTASFASFYRSVLDLLVARLCRRRICLHIHGGRFVQFCAAAGPLGRALIRRTCLAADAVITLTPRTLARLRPYLGESRLTVLPNGVPVPSSPPGQPPAGPCRFLYLGPLTRSKGVAELLDAARLLSASGVPFVLTLAGPPGAGVEDWRREIDDRGIARNVCLGGPVTPAGRDALLAACDCLVLPSHDEGLPLVLLEAGAAARPVIATAVGGIPELLAPGGGEPLAPLVAPRDAAALAAAMRQLAEGPALRAAIGRRLWRHVRRNYDLAAVAAMLGGLYGDLLRKRPVRRTADNGALSRLVRYVTYPLHERLCGRPTLAILRDLERLTAGSRAALDAAVARRVSDLLAFAVERLPYHADRARQRASPVPDGNPAPATASAPSAPATLARLPTLTKRDVRSHAAAMTWPGVPGGLLPRTSGGTSGDTLRFFVDRVRPAQDLAARLFMQAQFGVPPGARRLHLWGSPIECSLTERSPIQRCGRCLRRWRDRLLNEVLLDAFDLSPKRLDAHLARLLRYRPAVLYGYPSAVALLARHAAARGVRPAALRGLRLAVLTGEEVTAEQRADVTAGLGCPAAAEYGNREVGLIAHECPLGGLHVLSPHVLVEVLHGDQPAASGTLGEIVCTTLGTRGMPFIRYRLGDAGRLLPGTCPCGLPLPLMKLEGGRVTGLLALPDGRLCHGAVSTYAVQGLPGIVAYRTHQRTLERIEVLLVTDERFEPRAVEVIRARYRRLFGPAVQVECRLVDALPPDPSGKRRHVISDVAAGVICGGTSA